MNRRRFLKSAAALPTLPLGCARWPAAEVRPRPRGPRVRPGEPAWPSPHEWDRLNAQVQGRLLQVTSPLVECRKTSDRATAAALFRKLKNPFYIGDQAGLTQTSAWVDAWTAAPSVFVVAAARTEDVVAAVNFARERRLRLVIKGGGHSYQGTSNSADSLLVWTRAMNSVVMHDKFVARGCAATQAPQAAVTVGAGAVWIQAYDAVTTRGGRYVQGGGCTTVGVAGLIQSGGFGSFSKRYGLAAAGLLEAEVVTADGKVRFANARTHPDLFWGLKGGGGGSLGVVTSLTLRTRELPTYFGGVFGTIRAKTDNAFRRLIARLIGFYAQNLFNPHWGEQMVFEQGNVVRIELVFQGLTRQEAETLWSPVRAWLARTPEQFHVERPLRVVEVPARHFWDVDYINQHYPAAIVSDERPGAPPSHFFWNGDGGQAGHVLHGYKSAWLPASLLKTDEQTRLVEALCAATRHWGVSLHFNKGLAGAPADEIAAAKDTAINPAVLDAFSLAIIAANGPAAYPGVPGHEPDLARARRHADAVTKAMRALREVAPQHASYVSESDFFESSWQQSFWGSNYPRLRAIKQKYDPDGLFFVHHGVGSEEWSADGFSRLSHS